MFKDVMKSQGRLDLDIHKKIDVYAYAMTLYVITFGERPWNEEENSSVPFLVLRGERPTIFSTNAPILKQILVRAWSHEPSQRPSFDEICETLSCVA